MAKIPISELPVEIDTNQAAAQCYGEYIDRIMEAVRANQSVLVECDKHIVNDLLLELRRRNTRSPAPIRLEIVDHRSGDLGPTMNTQGALEAAVRSLAEQAASMDGKSSAVIVPNFDLLASSDQTSAHLDLLTRDLLAVLHENPDLVLVAFKDPDLNLPKSVSAFFPKRIEIFGIDRVFMPHLITQTEARRIDAAEFDPYCLYKYVSGLNVVKLRKILHGFASPRYTDGSGESILNEIRRATITDSEAELPSVPMSMIGGYEGVKTAIREDVLGILQFIQEKAAESGISELKAYEKLLPKNILFTGPPGTGKTLFCKAIATELNATIFIVNGPELKNKWVGESERAIRTIFTRARKCAPSLIVFDEIDSFARQRQGGGEGRGGLPGNDGGTVHDNSMLNQLLTEMDGFRTEEMVFVIATTNFAESLDNALLSRFKVQIEIPYPAAADRKAILSVYDRIYRLNLAPEVMDTLVKETEVWIDQNKWTRFAGRDLEAVAAALARHRLTESFKTKKPIPAIPITAEHAKLEVKSRVKTKPLTLTFADIGGYEDVKERLRDEILVLLQAAKKLDGKERRDVEAMIPKGVIFEGPPGTGKTMFAKALANELGANVSVVNGPELKGSFVGETEANIRKVFHEARKNAPSVIVFDELDSIASDRQNFPSAGVERSMVNQLLTEMDGISNRGLVFVVATTNFAKSLDAALKRPGRFEYIIHIGYPDQEARRKIISLYNAKYGLDLTDEAIEHLIFRTDNWVDPEAGIRFSGDHIEAVCRGIARRRLLDPSWQPSKENLDRVVAQRTKKPLEVTPEEETVIATHEAGHAIVSLRLAGCRAVKRISIASEYDGTLGYVLHEDIANKFVQNQEEILAEICCLLAGRMAEKKLLGKIATGGANDIEKATLMATHLVASFGMDETVGPRLVPHPLIYGPRAAGSASPELLRQVENGVEKILREQEKRAVKCLEEYWDEYNALRERLMTEKVVEFGVPVEAEVRSGL